MKVGRKDLKLPMAGKSLAYSKGALEFESLETDFILKKEEGEVAYYIFGISNAGDESTIYNFEVKEVGGDVERAELIEYSSHTSYEEDYSNLFRFSGTVTAYNEQKQAVAIGIFDEGINPECPSTYPPGEGGGGGGGEIPPSWPPNPSNPFPPDWPQWPGFPPSDGGGGDNGSPGSNPGGNDEQGCDSQWVFSHHVVLNGQLYWMYVNCKGATKKVAAIAANAKAGLSLLTPHCNDGSGVIILPGNPKNNPCEKTKQMLQNPEVQEKLEILKEESKTKGEKGINIAMDGTPSAIIDGGDHEVELGDSAGNKGGYHNHTPTGIPMLSPPDILKLFNYAMNFNNGNVGEAFNGIVGSDVCSACPGGYKYYHYLVRFNGTYQELANLVYANWDKDMYIRTYQRRYNELKKISEYYDSQLGDVNNKGLEKLFFDTLKAMNIENKVILQRVDETGTAPHINYSVQNITLDENNKPQAAPCP